MGTRPPGSVSVCIHLKPYIMLYKHRELVFQRGPSREGMREAKAEGCGAICLSKPWERTWPHAPN